jgi:hypothetical protein
MKTFNVKESFRLIIGKLFRFMIICGNTILKSILDILKLKDTGKHLSTAILVWSMWFFYTYAKQNHWSVESLVAMKDCVRDIVATVTVLVGASIGINKVVDKFK